MTEQPGLFLVPVKMETGKVSWNTFHQIGSCVFLLRSLSFLLGVICAEYRTHSEQTNQPRCQKTYCLIYFTMHNLSFLYLLSVFDFFFVSTSHTVPL